MWRGSSPGGHASAMVVRFTHDAPAVARPRQERATLALEEWVREAQDCLFAESAALAELYERQGLHVTRCAFHGDKLHQI